MDASAAVEGSSTYAALDVVFISLVLPGMAISVIGSSVLGIGLLRNRYEPRITAGLLALAFPSMLVLSTLLGHNGLALLPLFVAWGVAGSQLWRKAPAGAAHRLAHAA